MLYPDTSSDFNNTIGGMAAVVNVIVVGFGVKHLLSILDPVSTAHPGTRSSIPPSSAGRTDAVRGAAPEHLRHSLA